MPTLTSPCTVCMKPMRIFPTSSNPEHMTHRACRVPADSNCANCGELFRAAKRSGGKRVATCSKSCAMKLKYKQGSHPLHQGVIPLSEDAHQQRHRERDERKRRARRARLAGARSEPYTTAGIAKRDGFICALCGSQVDMKLRFPDSLSASVDHVLPLSKGGDDTLSNVSLAHLGCNSSKSNRI